MQYCIKKAGTNDEYTKDPDPCWEIIFTKLKKPYTTQNTDNRLFYRFKNNCFLIKRNFTFGIQKVESKHKHLIQPTRNNLLCFVLKGTGGVKSDNHFPVISPVESQDRFFPHTEKKNYTKFILKPEIKYILPENTQYILISPKWGCFAFHRVKDDFTPQFECTTLESLIKEKLEKKKPISKSYEIPPPTPAYDVHFPNLKPKNAKFLQPPSPKRLRIFSPSSSKYVETQDEEISNSSFPEDKEEEILVVISPPTLLATLPSISNPPSTLQSPPAKRLELCSGDEDKKEEILENNS